MDKFNIPIVKLAQLIYSDPAFKDYSCKITAIWDGWRIGLINAAGEEVDDAVCHSGSHGHEEGLLESYRLNECSGFETPNDVYVGWRRKYARRGRRK